MDTTEKTKLEKELEEVQSGKKRWGWVSLILVLLIIAILVYTVRLREELLLAKHTIQSLKIRVESLQIELESMKSEAEKYKEQLITNMDGRGAEESERDTTEGRP